MKDNLYYAVYDISSNSVRGKAVIALKNAGLSRIQKSVFCGMLNGQQLKDLRVSLQSLIAGDDRLYLIRSCESCFGKLETIGKSFDREYVSNEKGGEII